MSDLPVDGDPLVNPPATIGDAVRRAAGRFADTEALGDDRHRLDFTGLDRQVDAAARALLALGVGRGDTVALWAPNVAEWVFAALGALSVGCPVVPLNTRFQPPEAGDIVARSRARVAVCTEGFLGRGYAGELVELAGDLPHLEHVVAVPLPDADAPAPPAPPGSLSWEDFIAAGAEVDDDTLAAARAAVTPDDVGDIIFTSGTTGRPKGVVTTHAQSLRAFADWSGVVGLTHGDRYLVVNPFFHTFGYKAGILACLLRGATIICEPVFDAGRVLQRIGAERVSMLPGPPTLYLTILEHPDRNDVDLSSLRLAVTGAAAVPVEMVRRMHTDLGFGTVITGYGLTEATGVVAMCRAGDDPETIAATSGRAIPGVEVRVVDDAGNELPRGEAGEIVCRGYNVMVGYLDDPIATAETIDADGWLHTGDIGVMDDRGYVAITDRLKDMFIVGGFNAYPAEIENMLSEHPAVAQVAVVGVPDARMGEVGHAWVVPRAGVVAAGPDRDQLASDLVAWARERMANYKVPRRISIVDTLPTNASGKVLKYELRSKVAADEDLPAAERRT
jgi:acyl-CoA synthetase (AMP-forming)/AMP-acid ligase II